MLHNQFVDLVFEASLDHWVKMSHGIQFEHFTE
jgi:hypothetical protein